LDTPVSASTRCTGDLVMDGAMWFFVLLLQI
jgi:hypothetical protein